MLHNLDPIKSSWKFVQTLWIFTYIRCTSSVGLKAYLNTDKCSYSVTVIKMSLKEETKSSTRTSPLLTRVQMGRCEAWEMRISESKFNWQWQMFLCIKEVVNTFISKTILAFSCSENENRKQKKKVEKKNVHSFPSLTFQDKCPEINFWRWASCLLKTIAFLEKFSHFSQGLDDVIWWVFLVPYSPLILCQCCVHLSSSGLLDLSWWWKCPHSPTII